jgi:hypothetical protein
VRTRARRIPTRRDARLTPAVSEVFRRASPRVAGCPQGPARMSAYATTAPRFCRGFSRSGCRRVYFRPCRIVTSHADLKLANRMRAQILADLHPRDRTPAHLLRDRLAERHPADAGSRDLNVLFCAFHWIPVNRNRRGSSRLRIVRFPSLSKVRTHDPRRSTGGPRYHRLPPGAHPISGQSQPLRRTYSYLPHPDS